MPTELFSDNAATTLTSSPTTGATSFTVASSTGFPAAVTGTSQFRVIIGTEIITVTNVSGTTWTCVATTAAHAAADVVTHVLTAASLGNFVDGKIATSTAIGVRVHTVATQSSAGGWVQILFDAEDFDTDAFHDLVTNTGRFTVPAGKAGKYLVTATISYAINNTGTRHVSLMTNNTTRSAIISTNTPVTATTYRGRVSTIGVLTLAVGDYIHVEGYQDSGATLEVGDTTASGAVGETWFSATYLGA